MKAIETIYKGYRFRSRLEARWAVFFDEIKWPYSYEAEGYDLPSGRYLPDFYLPTENAFIEIKPSRDLTHREKAVAKELSQKSGKSIYILCGDPLEALAPNYPGMFCLEQDPDQGLSFLYLTDYELAAEKARQARFEHGESPKCGRRAPVLNWSFSENGEIYEGDILRGKIVLFDKNGGIASLDEVKRALIGDGA